MTSNIDITKPTEGAAYTADVRGNFSIAATEINDLQSNAATDEANIATLQSDVATNTTNIATNTTDITALRTSSLPDAPSDGQAYGRESAAWTPVLPLSGGTLTGELIVGGNGVAYNVTAFTHHEIAFDWNGFAVYVYVDGTQIGTVSVTPGTDIVSLTDLQDRIAALENEVTDLRAKLSPA
jgi:hypothetical protein